MAWQDIDPFKGRGKRLYAYPEKAVWLLEIDGLPVATCVTECPTPILEDNQRDRADSAGKRWGDGAVVARIPLGLYFEKLGPAKQAGDDRYIKRILNDGDYSKWRTKDGRI